MSAVQFKVAAVSWHGAINAKPDNGFHDNWDQIWPLNQLYTGSYTF